MPVSTAVTLEIGNISYVLEAFSSGVEKEFSGVKF